MRTQGLCVEECRYYNSTFLLGRLRASSVHLPGFCQTILHSGCRKGKNTISMHHPSFRKLNACTSTVLSTSLSLSLPSSPIFPSLHNWIMGGRGWSIVHCFGFPWFKSSSQSGWEGTREASRNLWVVKGVVEVLNGLRTLRGPQWCAGMKYNKPEFSHPKLRQIVLFEGWSAHYGFLHQSPNLYVLNMHTLCIWKGMHNKVHKRCCFLILDASSILKAFSTSKFLLLGSQLRMSNWCSHLNICFLITQFVTANKLFASTHTERAIKQFCIW